MQKILAWGFLIVVILGSVAVFYYQRQEIEGPKESTASVTPAPVAKEPVAPIIRYPLADSTEQNTKAEEDQVQDQPKRIVKPLPPLDNSDMPLKVDLESVFAEQSLGTLFYLEGIIRRFVVTVDNLPRAKLPRKYLSTRSVSGRFLVIRMGGEVYLSEENFTRYTSYVELLESVDSTKLVAIYTHFYPLFQQAYEDLGYPSAYFNDRLIDVIDHLLDTPEIKEPIRLRQPHVLYTYADPDLEALSSGQKALLRSGQRNVNRIKVKLREFRTSLLNRVKTSASTTEETPAEQ